ncbi:MAG TPA: heparinase II/III family protein, partial [Clostridia bacterium]|nr:heparinase II/III family protein [Clostridia bacterium]
VLGAFGAARHKVIREHARLFGSRDGLRALARQRATKYERVKRVAADEQVDDYAWIISAAIVAAIDGNLDLAKKVQQRAMKMVDGPIRVGHVTFGTDLALCGMAYDLCSEAWTESDCRKLCAYINKTVDGNVQSELAVFHNAWYGYKNWGIGVACYATYHENERAPAILSAIEQDYATRAAPALEMAGEGGGWAEGYYIHYWLYEWLFFCEVARQCEGVDYYLLAPKFYRNRAIASIFETYPGISEYNSRRCVPMGDGGGRLFGGDRDKVLNARRILVSRFSEDPLHQAAHTFNEITPRCSIGNYAYKDFLWHDTSITTGDLKKLPLSHFSKGPGFVYARSSWDDDATYFFFKCGDRFTAHQHLDVNHFLIYKHAELAGDGGHYDDFGSPHDVNYHLRSIAHSTMLVLDPGEQWPGIRGGAVSANDGGQHHNWRHHNGAATDPAEWLQQQDKFDIAELLACEEHGDYLYVAGDASRAYSPQKLKFFTRQIVFLRPNTFVVFDRVTSTKPEFRKTWLLQGMRKPEKAGQHLVITNGKGRLFVQTLLPVAPEVRLISGAALYQVNGRDYPPRRDTGPAPECRIEVSPKTPATDDFFLHVLTAGNAETVSVPVASAEGQGTSVLVQVGSAKFRFGRNALEFERIA